jgi:PhnB protein
MYVYCDDVDALFKRATAAGAKVERPVQDQFWGDRMGSLVDPEGHIWTFATNVADFDPSKAPK